MQNYYELLGITIGEPQETISSAFRNKIKHVHPDKHTEIDKKVEQQNLTIQLYQAYKTLKDPQTRKQYDQRLKQSLKESEISVNRYFEQTVLVEQEGKWYAECEQCLGQTQIGVAECSRICEGDKNLLIRCWHCNLGLSVFI